MQSFGDGFGGGVTDWSGFRPLGESVNGRGAVAVLVWSLWGSSDVGVYMSEPLRLGRFAHWCGRVPMYFGALARCAGSRPGGRVLVHVGPEEF